MCCNVLIVFISVSFSGTFALTSLTSIACAMKGSLNERWQSCHSVRFSKRKFAPDSYTGGSMLEFRPEDRLCWFSSVAFVSRLPPSTRFTIHLYLSHRHSSLHSPCNS
jgi:hypothetical protein